MRLLNWRKARSSRDRTEDNFESSLPSLLNGAFTDVQLKNFGAARSRLLDALRHRSEIKERALVRFILLCLGQTWSLQEQYREGIEFFSDYIGRHPDDAEAYTQRATMLWYSDQPDEAVRDYSRALELFPRDGFALSCLGQALVELGKHKDALYDLDLALQYVDEYPTWDLAWRKRSQAYVRNGRAAALAGLGEFERALKEFEVSISLCPDNAWVYYNRAKAYDARGERDKAISDYRFALVKREPRLRLSKSQDAEARLRALLGREKSD